MSFQLNLTTESVKFAYPTEPLTVDPSEPIRAVLLLMKQQREACVLVTQEGRLAGIFTERDALRIMAKQEGLDRPVSEVMVTQPETVCTSQSVGQAISRMSVGGYRRLPIMEDGRPVGVLSVPGILRYLVDHFPKIIYTLPPDPRHATQEREGA